MAIKHDNLERLSPRLRVVCNGDAEVNGLRAELSAAVEAKPAIAKRFRTREKLLGAASKPPTRRLTKPPSQARATDAVTVNCFVTLASSETARGRVPGPQSVKIP